MKFGLKKQNSEDKDMFARKLVRRISRSENEIWRYEIPFVPPSNNKYIGRNNRWGYAGDKKNWESLVYVYCREKPEEPIVMSEVKLTYYFKTKIKHDPDNYSGKFILDGLVKAGIIKDDSFNNIELILIGKHDKDNPRTEIVVEEVKR
jgi:crossover junction endodeoxyribonuclease RusA